MTTLPQQNAILVSVAGGAVTEDYNAAGGSPITKWTGSVGAYVKRKSISNFNAAGELNRQTIVNLIIPGDMEPAYSLNTGDVVTFTQFNPVDQTTDTYTGKVQDYVTPANLTSLPNYVDIALERVRVISLTA